MIEKPTLENLNRLGGVLLLEYISGSRAYGTNIETSDLDVKGVYALPERAFASYGFGDSWEEIQKSADIKYYEIRKFIRLLAKNNPNTLEVFNIPEDCLLYVHPCLSSFMGMQDLFLSKLCYATFSGYQQAQMNKAMNLEKYANWKKDRIQRLTPLHFLYVLEGKGEMPAISRTPFQSYMESVGKTQDCFELAPRGKSGFWLYEGSHGVLKDDSTNLRTVPYVKGRLPLAALEFDMDGWTKHCKEYESYQKWLNGSNPQRRWNVKGQIIDGKHMLHLMRLGYMSMDIAKGKGVVVRRPEVEELLDIRRGKYTMDEILEKSDALLRETKSLYESSDLQKAPDESKIAGVLSGIREALGLR
jgi:predicted nucleotidyltransferase